MTEKSTEAKVEEAQTAALKLAQLSNDERSAALNAIADAITARQDEILEANERDVHKAEDLLAEGEYSQALVDRLKLSPSKLDSITEMVRSVASQDDPLGKTQIARKLDEDLELYKCTVPIGVIGTIFESRPDALIQIAALGLKSGNAVILKGGSEASHSNRILFDVIREATSDMPDGWSQLIEARADVDTLLEMDDSIDLLMPRGSSEFVGYIQDNTSIAVLGHTEGICHVYVDDAADLPMATDIAYDAKVQYPAVCNAVETLLVHESVAADFLPEIAQRYEEANVEMRGDDVSRSIVDMEQAQPDDWKREYGDLIIAIKIVDSLEAAIDHISTYSSKHTESIVTQDADRASRFMRSLDSASVFHNASTRFSDGYRYGLGAEVGISTGKIHARGPVGLEGLTTYQYYLEGDGQTVGTYAGRDAKQFTHEDFDGSWNPGSRFDW
ncbi:glutamate-5-semialdehyde dehydrogenase [Haladaptatus sp. DFWS20]|uniref:glutamate-5-semialdehyde dehydrogenase n=1 Tax=Haladaptatus sp. DFWS20 TaxID=3403467 RepID=UPI003EC0F233